MRKEPFKIIVLLVVWTLLFCSLLSGCVKDDSADINDIEFNYEENYFYITPRVNINDVTIEYILEDEDNIVLGTYTKSIGNLIADRTYKIRAKALFSTVIAKHGEITKLEGIIKGGR